MPISLQAIRSFRWLARSVLAWLVLSIGVAVASPLVHPQPMELICAGAGAFKLMVPTGDTQERPSHTLDCPLCVPVGAPPPTLQADLPVPHPLAHGLRFIPAAHIAERAGARMPPRGPPAFS